MAYEFYFWGHGGTTVVNARLSYFYVMAGGRKYDAIRRQVVASGLAQGARIGVPVESRYKDDWGFRNACEVQSRLDEAFITEIFKRGNRIGRSVKYKLVDVQFLHYDDDGSGVADVVLSCSKMVEALA